MLNPRLEIWQSGTELQEALNLWLESLEARGVAPCTRDGVKEFVAFLEPHATTLDAVQPAHICKWRIHKQRKGVSPYTVRNASRLPRLFWWWCKRRELITNGPSTRCRTPECRRR